AGVAVSSRTSSCTNFNPVASKERMESSLQAAGLRQPKGWTPCAFSKEYKNINEETTVAYFSSFIYRHSRLVHVARIRRSNCQRQERGRRSRHPLHKTLRQMPSRRRQGA